MRGFVPESNLWGRGLIWQNIVVLGFRTTTNPHIIVVADEALDSCKISTIDFQRNFRLHGGQNTKITKCLSGRLCLLLYSWLASHHVYVFFFEAGSCNVFTKFIRICIYYGHRLSLKATIRCNKIRYFYKVL